MPQWLFTGLAFYGGVCVIVTIIFVFNDGLLPRIRFNRRRSIRARIASLKGTMYNMEHDISELNRFARDQNAIMTDIVKEMKAHSITLTHLQDWKAKVHKVTRTWEEFKEAGPDGP